jgi:hypothetical protein
MDEDDERPGPRDWKPKDPDSAWWNPQPGDAYGPSDQEVRQPWERQGPARRFDDPFVMVPGPVIHEPPASSRPPTLPPEVAAAALKEAAPPAPAKKMPETQFSDLTNFMVLVVFLAIVVLIVAYFVRVYGTEFRAEAIIGAGASVRAWAGRGRSWVVRLPLFTVAAAIALLHPAGVALIVARDAYVPGVFLSAAALVLAAAAGFPAAFRHPIYVTGPGAVKEPERGYSNLTGSMALVLMLAAAALVVAIFVGLFSKDLRAAAGQTLFYAVAVAVEALVITGAGAFARAWAGRGRSWVVRLPLVTVAAAIALLHPAGVALIVARDAYVPGVFLSAAALALAAAAGIPAALRHPIYVTDGASTEPDAG